MFGFTNAAKKYTKEQLDAAVAGAEAEADRWKWLFDHLVGGQREYTFSFVDGSVATQRGGSLVTYDDVVYLKLDTSDYSRTVFEARLAAIKFISAGEPEHAEPTA